MDWAQPWWQDYRALGQPIARRILSGEAVWQALNAPPAQTAHAGWSVSFVPQADLPPEQAYEAHIFQTHRVPTRCGAHDFFNGLIWQHWPQTKRVLNALQWAQIEKDGVQKTRGPLRDALTLLDENGALLIAPRAIWDALVTRDWVTALHTHRSLWASARLYIVGHALLEQLLLFPRKSLTAHLWLPTPAFQDTVSAIPHMAGMRTALDAAWAQALASDGALAHKPFTPLPVMGTPGWVADNADAAYYADTAVFRPLRAGQMPPRRMRDLPAS
jgi:hypothetical protein